METKKLQSGGVPASEADNTNNKGPAEPVQATVKSPATSAVLIPGSKEAVAVQETKIEEQNNEAEANVQQHPEISAKVPQEPSQALEEKSPLPSLNPLGTISGALSALKENPADIKAGLADFLSGETSEIAIESLPAVSLRLGGLCNFPLESLPQFVQTRREKETGTTIPLLEFLTFAQQYMEEESAVRASETVVDNKPDMEALHSVLALQSVELKKTFDTLAKEGKIKGRPAIALAVAKLLKSAGVGISVISGDERPDEAAETIAELAERVEGKEVALDFDSLLSYIESYVTDNGDIVINYQKPSEGRNEMLLDPREYAAEEKLTKTAEKGRAEDELVKQLLASIKQYEELLQTQVQQGKDTTATRDLIALLTHQMDEYKGEGRMAEAEIVVKTDTELPAAKAKEKADSKMSDDRGLNIEQLRAKGIKEIFYFYCRQQYLLGKGPTFDQLYMFNYHMTIGEFMKFCKDFRIPLKASKIKELFKRYAKSSKELEFDGFTTMLQRLASQITDTRIEGLRERIRQLDATRTKAKIQGTKDVATLTENLALPDDKVSNKESSPEGQVDSEAKPSTPRTLEKERCQNEIAAISSMSDPEKLEELHVLLECHDKARYRKKLVGIVNSKEKSNNRPPRDDRRGKAGGTEKTADEIKREVEQLKRQRIEKKVTLEREEKGRNERNRIILKKLYEQQVKQRMGALEELKTKQLEREREPTYKELKNRQLGIPIQAQQVTWQVLKTLTYKDIRVGTAEEEFRPSDFIEEVEAGDEDFDVIRRLCPKKAAVVVSAESASQEVQETVPTPDIASLIQRVPGTGLSMKEGRKSVPPKRGPVVVESIMDIGGTQMASYAKLHAMRSKYVLRASNQTPPYPLDYPYGAPRRYPTNKYNSKPENVSDVAGSGNNRQPVNLSYSTMARAEQIEREEKRRETERCNRLLGMRDRQFMKARHAFAKK